MILFGFVIKNTNISGNIDDFVCFVIKNKNISGNMGEIICFL